MIRLINELITDDRTGKLFVRYIPILDLSGYPCASGELRFATYDVEVGMNTAEHDRAKAEAVSRAAESLTALAAMVAR